MQVIVSFAELSEAIVVYTSLCLCKYKYVISIKCNYAPGKETHFFVFIIQNTFIYKQTIFTGTVRKHCKTVFCSV